MPKQGEKKTEARTEQPELEINEEPTKRFSIGWVRGSEPTPEFYGNHLQVSTTPWDLTLHIGRLESSEDGSVVAREVANIIWSPQHARAALEVLYRQIQVYERDFGPLDIYKKVLGPGEGDKTES